MATADTWTGAIDRMLGRIQDTAARVKDGFSLGRSGDGHWTTPRPKATGRAAAGSAIWAAAAARAMRYRSWAEPLAERLRARIDAQTVFKPSPRTTAPPSAPSCTTPRTAEIVRSQPRAPDASLRAGLRWCRSARSGGGRAHRRHRDEHRQHASGHLAVWAAGVHGRLRARDVATNHAETILNCTAARRLFHPVQLVDGPREISCATITTRVQRPSTWGRAQAWECCSRGCATGRPQREAWLAAAMAGADWWLAHWPADRVAFWTSTNPPSRTRSGHRRHRHRHAALLS